MDMYKFESKSGEIVLAKICFFFLTLKSLKAGQEDGVAKRREEGERMIL